MRRTEAAGRNRLPECHLLDAPRESGGMVGLLSRTRGVIEANCLASGEPSRLPAAVSHPRRLAGLSPAWASPKKSCEAGRQPVLPVGEIRGCFSNDTTESAYRFCAAASSPQMPRAAIAISPGSGACVGAVVAVAGGVSVGVSVIVAVVSVGVGV